MMTEIMADDLLRYIQSNDVEPFRNDIAQFLVQDNVMNLIIQCNEEEIKVAVEWSRMEKIYLIHKIFERVESMNSIAFLKSQESFERFDHEKRTWLHVAVIHDRSYEILKFLIDVKGISIDSEDDYAYTPLHHYCQKEKYKIKVLTLLMKSQDHLTKQSKDGLSPLEFACSNPDNLQLIMSIESVDMKSLLRKIDDISNGVIEVEKYSLTNSFSTDRIWLNLLQKNDKYMLISYIKNDSFFIDKYYMEPADILAIIKKCPENGQGILPYIKGRFFKGTNDPQLFKILSGLTGIKMKEQSRKRIFYKSALFLALITGRFQLISPLLRSCQFEIQSFAMLICLVCKNLATKKRFPDQVIKDILDLKDFCQDYAIEVMYRTYNKDLSEDKAIISKYINRNSEKLVGKSILEVAYHAKCSKYLSLPPCQESLTNVWTERSMKCPQIKFWLHSSTHVAFLILFSFVVVNNLFSRISAAEVICYIYGLGYLTEELRQIYLSIKDDFMHSYCVDAANIIDICGVTFMLIGFLLRVCLSLPDLPGSGEFKMFYESRNSSLFILRLVLCLSLLAFYMRVLYFASINHMLGPKLKMISTMIVKNLIPLIFIFIVFMISFGVTFQSLLFPNSFYTKESTTGGNFTFFRKTLLGTVGDIFRRSTFTIFDFHYTLNDVESNHNNIVTDIYGSYAVYFLLIIFMVVVNVMLMNLLIALFANTVTTIIYESKQSWKISRYGFIHEYSDRTIAPPPFNILCIAIEILSHLVKTKIANKKSKVVNNVHDEEDIPLQKVPQDVDTKAEPSMSYYIYQAFAMSGQRYRLMKDANDTEYEKEVHFKTIEKKLKNDKMEIKKTIEDRCKAIEKKISSLSTKKSHQSISSSASFI